MIRLFALHTNEASYFLDSHDGQGVNASLYIGF